MSFDVHLVKEETVLIANPQKKGETQSIKIFRLKTKITNTSDETIYFLNVTCKQEEMYSLKNSELFHFHSITDCEKSSPTLISLKPNEFCENEIAITPLMKDELLPASTVIGFEFIEYIPGSDFDIIDSYQARHTSGKTIWSEPFSLKK